MKIILVVSGDTKCNHEKYCFKERVRVRKRAHLHPSTYKEAEVNWLVLYNQDQLPFLWGCLFLRQPLADIMSYSTDLVLFQQQPETRKVLS